MGRQFLEPQADKSKIAQEPEGVFGHGPFIIRLFKEEQHDFCEARFVIDAPNPAKSPDHACLVFNRVKCAFHGVFMTNHLPQFIRRGQQRFAPGVQQGGMGCLGVVQDVKKRGVIRFGRSDEGMFGGNHERG